MLGLVNHIAGAVLGLVLAVVIVWLGFLIMTLAYTTEAGNGLLWHDGEEPDPSVSCMIRTRC